MRVLCTGGCGYVGSVLVPKLLHAGHDVVVVDAQWFGNYLPKHERLVIVKTDIRGVFLDNLGGVDAVIHLASVANDPCCDLDPRLSWEVNCLATQQLCDAAARAGVRQFIYASSGSVYGISDAPQVTEDTPLLPISDYNRTKIVAERVVLSYADRMAVQLLRPGTVCGLSPRQRLDVAVNAMAMGALSNGRVTVNGGEQTRPNVHIRDMVDAYCFMLARPDLTGVYNVGFENLTIKQVADTISARFKAPIVRMPSDDPRSYRLNSDKLLAAGFKPSFGVTDAISEIAEAYHGGLLFDDPKHYNVQRMLQTGIAA